MTAEDDLPAPRALHIRFGQDLRADTFEDDTAIRVGASTFLPATALRKVDPAAYEAEFEDWRRSTWQPALQDELGTILQCAPDNLERFGNLARAAMKGTMLPFVGSGMSVPSGYQTWSEFLRGLHARSKLPDADFEGHLACSYEDAAEAVLKAMPKQLFEERFQATFDPTPRGVAGAVQWLPHLFDGLAITTNYDQVLERAYADAGTPFDAHLIGQDIADERRVTGQGKRTLVKIHGDCNKSAGRVLTRTEYDKVYAQQTPALEALQRLFVNRPLLFLGCSLQQDRTMQVFAEACARDDQIPRHYALLRLPDSTSSRVDKEHFLAERNIFPIWYDGDHSQSVETLLASLAMRGGRA